MRRHAPRRRPAAEPDPGFLRDVERFAEVVCETIGRLDAAGLREYAEPLEAALVRLAGQRR